MHKYIKLKFKLKATKPEVITVDIFDTLLLRNWKSEQLRFYDISCKMTDAFKKYGLRAEPHLIFRQRNLFSEQVRLLNVSKGKDHETSHQEIFSLIINDLERRNGKKLNNSSATSLLRTLNGIELQYEESVLKPNYSLIKLLRRESLKGKRIYFISDMYLNSKQLEKLLVVKGIDFISGGISSADKLLGKYSGRSYGELANKHQDIKLNKSLHIGDNKFSDYRVPKQNGIMAHLIIMPLHSIKITVGRVGSKFILAGKLKKALRSDKKKYLKKLRLNKLSANNQSRAIGIGWLLAPSIIYYLDKLGVISRLNNKNVVFVSSESYIFSKIYKELGFKNSRSLPGFNRNKLIRAYCSVMLKKGIRDEQILNFVYKVLRTKKISSVNTVLGIKSIEDKIHLFTGSDERNKIIPLSTAKKLCDNEYKSVLKSFKLLKTINKGAPIISDIGWSGSVQILLEQILKDDGMDLKIQGIYMGRTGTNIFNQEITSDSSGVVFNSLSDKGAKYLYQPEVWESILNLDNEKNITRQEILSGIDGAIQFFKESGASSWDFYKYSSKKLLKTLKRPDRDFIEIMASLNFDYGTIDEPPYPLVNITKSTSANWRWLLFDRKKFKKLYFEQGWKWGAATYYHFRIPYRIWRKISGKPSF